MSNSFSGFPPKIKSDKKEKDHIDFDIDIFHVPCMSHGGAAVDLSFLCD